MRDRERAERGNDWVRGERGSGKRELRIWERESTRAEGEKAMCGEGMAGERMGEGIGGENTEGRSEGKS